ncbi:MAG: excinuclease ABC subunit UvrC [Candidatus Saccharimonadales bacterium]
MNEQLHNKLKDLPKDPGVYFHKDKKGEIIYVGKAAILRNRVRQYFQKSRSRDPKTTALVEEIYDTDWMVVDSEIEALFLEAEMIRRYMPKYNILLRDDKSDLYIRIDYNSDYPTVTTTRRPLDDGARYFGPYLSSTSVRQALKYLRKIFPFATSKSPGRKRASLYYHIGLDPGLEESRTSLEDYRKNLRRLMSVIEGNIGKVEKELEGEMKQVAAAHNFEQAAKKRNQLMSLRSLRQKVIFSDKEFQDISKDHALDELVRILGLTKFPIRIEGYDVSHMQGTDVVASMVVFTNGVSSKAEYRKFKTKKDQNNDFYNMNETIKRRLSKRHVDSWRKPDLVLIDGGKGQVDAAIKARDEAGQVVPFIGLAKREEQIIVDNSRSLVNVSQAEINKLGGFLTESENFTIIDLPKSTNVIKLLQRIRDESHRFAVSYHSTLKRGRMTSSELDEIPGVGPVTKKKLLKIFGSLAGIKAAKRSELAKVVGDQKSKVLVQYFKR